MNNRTFSYLLYFLFFGAGMSVSAEQLLWSVKGFLPGVERPYGKFSAAKWLWHKETPCNGGICYFRKIFRVEGPIAKASANIAWDDFKELYINGVQKEGVGAFASSLVQGENTIAVKVLNATGPAGLIFFGEVVEKSGRRVSLRSDRSFRCSPIASEGWEKHGFDDSSWEAAREQGDVTMKPFSHYRDYSLGFTTVEERAKLKEVETEFDGPLPASLAAEPAISAKVVYDGWMPKININGRNFDPAFNLYACGEDYAWNQAIKLNSLGVNFHRISISANNLEKALGKYDFSELDRMARQVLKFVPDAYLGITLPIDLPKWCAGHPQEMIGYGDGEIGTVVGDDLSGRPRKPSAASAEFRVEVARLMAELGEYVRSRDWGNRVATIRPCWGIYTEWHVYGMYHSPDTGLAMTAAFRRWKDGKYAEENPPTVEERTHGGILLNPVKDAKVIDYFECLQSEVADLLIHSAREAKKALPGRLVGFYYGYVLGAHPPEGSNVMLDKVLAAPEVDFLSNPTVYTPGSRRSGGAYYHRTIPPTYHRYGKLAIIEDDMRHHHVLKHLMRDWSKNYAAQTPRESRMTMRRNLLNGLFDGCGIQFCDATADRGLRFGAHDDPEMLAGFADALEAIGKAGTVALKSGNDTAVVVDWRECLRRDKNAGNHMEYRKLVSEGPELAYRSGAAFDLITLDDYLALERDYPKVVFFNFFNPTAEHAAAVRAKIEKPGVKAIRFVLLGSAKDALGPSVRTIKMPPEDAQGWADIFSSLGTHMIAPPWNYVRRHGGLVMFHTAKSARQKLSLPPEYVGCKVVELFSDKTYEDLDFEVVTDGPDTFLFKLY